MRVRSVSGCCRESGESVFLPGEEGVHDLAEKARAAGSPTVEGPIERPWNMREVTITDLDGYRPRFSGPIDMDKSFYEVMSQMTGEA
jgi:hypothetical protein